MGDLLRAFFNTRLLNPHGICLLWRPELLWTHVVSDVLIGLAYFSIPLALAAFLYKRRDIRFGWAIWMFVAFIMLCGLTHFMSVWTLWHPDYGVEALLKGATGAASVVTALALWPLLPRVIAIPSTTMLQARIRERDEALSGLETAMQTMVAMEEHQAKQTQLMEELRETAAQLRSLVDNAAVGIARVGVDGRFLSVNDRFCEIAGWSREEMLAGGFQRITHRDDLDGDLAHVEDLLQARADWYAMEKRYVRADGGTAWVKLTVSIVRTELGEPDHFVAIVEDVTAEKRARDARELLMREVDHRARNALTIVQSMARLTEAADPSQFKQVLTGRVDALARAQGSLSRSNWEGAQVSDIVAQELEAIAPADAFELSGPATLLDPDDVQPLSMIVHELATNAAKHGALSRAGGKVRVEWANTGRNGYNLLWTERGGPAVAPPSRLGFGSRLMRRLADQLQAAASFEWQAEGLTFRLEGGRQGSPGARSQAPALAG